ncbi:unnamed protein product [Pleuronectes platessa]|uniref:Uncharacterized protein n=1 Tax=Pleuronectes platessa TaxID=8262 RepID=A0A9N7TSS6_PLEPL|nr:unnamed protein product [Pleuronectes platessa]
MSATFPGLVHDAEIRHDGSNSYRLMQLGCLESVANSSVAYSSSSPLTYPAPAGTEFASPYFSANHQYTPLHHQSFHYEFQHSHPAVAPEAYGLNSLHSGQYYQQLHHGEPADFINLHSARSALKSSCLDEQQRRELGCLDAYRRHDLSLMTSHGSQAYGMHHADQRLLPAAGLGLPPAGGDDLQLSVTVVLSFPPGCEPLVVHVTPGLVYVSKLSAALTLFIERRRKDRLVNLSSHEADA